MTGGLRSGGPGLTGSGLELRIRALRGMVMLAIANPKGKCGQCLQLEPHDADQGSWGAGHRP